MVNRYDPATKYVGSGEYAGSVAEDDLGDYVLYDDYKALESKLQAAEFQVTFERDGKDVLERRLKAAESRLGNAREAFREALVGHDHKLANGSCTIGNELLMDIEDALWPSGVERQKPESPNLSVLPKSSPPPLPRRACLVGTFENGTQYISSPEVPGMHIACKYGETNWQMIEQAIQRLERDNYGRDVIAEHVDSFRIDIRPRSSTGESK